MKLKVSLWRIRKRIIKRSKRKEISNSSNSFPRIALFIVLCCSLQMAHAQKKYDAHSDSLVKSFLIENNILLDPVHKVKYVKGKKVSEISNYYLNKRNLKVSDTSSVSLTVFGTLSSHLRDYLLIEYNTPGNSERVYVGQRLFEEDIMVLKTFFEKRGELPLATKRNILEAFSKLN